MIIGWSADDKSEIESKIATDPGMYYWLLAGIIIDSCMIDQLCRLYIYNVIAGNEWVRRHPPILKGIAKGYMHNDAGWVLVRVMLIVLQGISVSFSIILSTGRSAWYLVWVATTKVTALFGQPVFASGYTGISYVTLLCDIVVIVHSVQVKTLKVPANSMVIMVGSVIHGTV